MDFHAMEICKSMEINMDFHGNLQIHGNCYSNRGNPFAYWKFMEFHRNSWKSMDNYQVIRFLKNPKCQITSLQVKRVYTG